MTESPIETVFVDVVEPGHAVITFADRCGYVRREDSRRFYVRDTDSDVMIGHARTYRIAGEIFAKHHGMAGAPVEVNYES